MASTLILYSLSMWYVTLAPVTECISWTVADQLDAHALDNLSSKENHELLLRELSQKDFFDLFDHLLLEFVTMITGNDFYRLTEDDATNQENHLIAKTMVDLSHKLPFQKVAYNMISDVLTEAQLEIRVDGKIGDAMTKACQKIHSLYAAHDDYKSARQLFKNKMAKGEYKIYHYEVPKNKDQLREILASLWSTFAFKKTFINFSLFGSTTHAEALATEGRILRLLENPKNVNLVQSLYGESVDETARELGDLRPTDVNLSSIFRDTNEYRTLWAKKMKEKLDAHPQLIQVTKNENV